MAVQLPVSTTLSQLDALVQRVKEHAHAFARLTLDDRIHLLEQMREGYGQVAEESVIAACQAKGIDPNSPLAGEEWLSGPMVTIRILRLTAESLRDIKQYGAPRIQKSWLSHLPDGRLVVKLHPTTKIDSTLLAGHTGYAYMQAGVTAENLREHQASFYRKPHEGRLCVVLGAGNVNAIPPTDVIYKMFVEGAVCVLKMNPVNAYLGPFIERAFKPVIDRGFLAVAYGGAEEGAYLIQHPLVDEIHITGSDKTHDAMVWGPAGPEREARKQRGDPLLKKEITSELGNITPVLVVPGPYDDGELTFQGRNVAGMVANNASFNCISAKLLVTSRDWAQRGRAIDLIERGLQGAQVRRAYYPGAEARWQQFTEGRKGLRLVGAPKKGELPYALILDVDPNNPQDRVFQEEPWCTVLSETSVAGADPASFLANAVKFVNENVWGTLCATLVVHPRTMKDPAGREAVEKAIRDLRYGGVTVNTWAATAFGLGTTPWGGYPGSPATRIQSGRGWVHNTFMLEDIEKSVVRAPLKVFPISPWFPGHRTLDKLAKGLTELELNPSWLKVPGLAATAMRG